MNHPIVILEGPDGAGKTTLAKEIGGAYIHCTYNKDLIGNMTGYFIGVLSAAIQLSEKSPVIIDRWRMSEVVYGKAFRAGPENPWATDALYKTAEDAGAKYVFCLPSSKLKYLDAFNRLKDTREEMYDRMDKVYDIYNAEIVSFISSVRDPESLMVYDRFTMSPAEGSARVSHNFFK